MDSTTATPTAAPTREQHAHQSSATWGVNVNAHAGFKMFIAVEDAKALRAALAAAPDCEVAADLLAKLDAAAAVVSIDLTK